jgi:hypothetical protein
MKTYIVSEQPCMCAKIAVCPKQQVVERQRMKGREREDPRVPGNYEPGYNIER